MIMKKNIPFISYYKIWLTIGAITVVLSLSMLAIFKLKPGIDFTSGSLQEITFSSQVPSVDKVQQVFSSLNFKDAIIQKTEQGFIARTKFLDESEHQNVLQSIKKTFETPTNKVTEQGFETIGPVVSSQLRSRALWAVLLVSCSIIIYLAYAFRKVSKPVESWKYGLMAVIAMIHDILLVLGVFAVLGHYFGVEIDIAFVVAILTVLGFSVNDTIVVYDRIRENLLHHSSNNFSEVVNSGLNETLMRSCNTTLTVLLPLFALYFFGGASLHNFTLALLIGMASGAYSSIFIASPLLVLAERWKNKKLHI
jgi:preprotein translocase subunit SecF